LEGAAGWVVTVGVWSGAPLGRSVPGGVPPNLRGPPGRAASRSLREPGSPRRTGGAAKLPDRPRGAPDHRARCGGGPPPGAAGRPGYATRLNVSQVTCLEGVLRWTHALK